MNGVHMEVNASGSLYMVYRFVSGWFAAGNQSNEKPPPDCSAGGGQIGFNRSRNGDSCFLNKLHTNSG
jgi:hypothetical protein